MSKKGKREKQFQIVKDPDTPGQYLVQTKEGETICPAVRRSGEDVWHMRYGNWRLVYMAYVEDNTGEPAENGEFWVREEYAYRVPCW